MIFYKKGNSIFQVLACLSDYAYIIFQVNDKNVYNIELFRVNKIKDLTNSK